MFRKTIAMILLGAILASVALGVTGPTRVGVVEGTTSGVKININTITAGVAPNGPKISTFVACADAAFLPMAWKYDGNSFTLVYPAAGDTTSGEYGALANSFVEIAGKYDFLVVKTEATANVSFQVYYE